MVSKLKPLYNMIIMTSSVECYAKAIYEIIDPDSSIFSTLLTKNSCLSYGRKSVKDLSIFEGVSLEDIVLIDNFAYAYSE